MNTRLRSELEKAIQKWMDDNCGKDDWPTYYVYETEYVDMAKAAELVFDASISGQIIADQEG